MANQGLFGEILDATEQLTMDEKESLIEIMWKRMAEIKRQELIDRVQRSVREYESGNYHVGTPDQIMTEILS